MSIWQNKIVRVGALVTSLSAGATAFWTAGDYLEIRPIIKREYLRLAQSQADIVEQLQQSQSAITQNLASLEVKLLLDKKAAVGLSFDEQQRLCRLARELRYVGIPGC